MRVLGGICRGGLAWCLPVVAAVMLWPASAAAGALVWSTPSFLNAEYADSGLADLTCPASTECVAVDSHGREAVFDPDDPHGWSAYAIDGTHALTAVSCAAASQCVAVDHRGAEISFDPELVGAAPQRHVIDSRHMLFSVSCPAVDLCAAVDGAGRAVSFDPERPSGARPVSLGGRTVLSAIACPSAAQCIALDSGRSGVMSLQAERMITFDPGTGVVSSTLQVPGTSDLTALSCPTPAECVGAGTSVTEVDGQPAGEGGSELTFDPTSATIESLAVRSPVYYLDVACVSASVCTAMDASGTEVTFDPDAAGVLGQGAVDPLGDWAKGFNGSRIACLPTGICVLVTTTSYASSSAITFAPLSPGKPAPSPVDDGAAIPDIACPGTGECIGLANSESGLFPGPVGGVVAPLDPASRTHVDIAALLGGAARGLACPTRTQCTAVTAAIGPGYSGGRWSRAETFNPTKLLGRHLRELGGPRIDRHPVAGLACATRYECTAVDDRGREVSFNPHRPAARFVQTESAKPLEAVACPSAAQCTAVGEDGSVVTFAPATGIQTVARQIDGAGKLTAIACPDVHRCSAVDQHGREIITFDPQQDRRPLIHRIATAELTGIACPSRRLCVAVSDSGEAAVGDPAAPARWAVAPVPGAGSLLAVACASATACVVADSAGQAFATIPHPRA